MKKKSDNFYQQKFKNIKQDQDLKELLTISLKSSKKLIEEINNKKILAIDIVNNTDDLKIINNYSKQISKYKKLLVLGVGGSSLGAKTICALKNQKKIDFIESIDPNTIINQLSLIDYKKTFFLVVSKSGETVETICQTLVILEEIKKRKIKNFSQQFLFITESVENSLAKIALKIKAKIEFCSAKISGRYSCFSIIGLLPAEVIGVNIKKIRSGAKKILDNFLLNPNEVALSTAIHLNLYEKGFKNNVIIPYIDVLKNYNKWYRQLWAESLGKNSFGSTPINSMGTVDQHSQLQLYLEGVRDKFFTFIILNKQNQDLKIKDLNNIKTLFGNKKLSEIIKIEHNSTIETLDQKKIPLRIIELSKIDEEVLGGLMMQMFLETIITAYCKNINPFDQPAVEFRKDLAKKLLNKK